MGSIREWYESLSVECILALDELAGHGGPHSDESLLYIANHFYQQDLSKLDDTVSTELYGELQKLLATQNPLHMLEKTSGPLDKSVAALLCSDRISDGILQDLNYAPGKFRICLGQVEDADVVVVDGISYQPMGSIKPIDGQMQSYAWVAFHPQDVNAPVFLAESSGEPEQLAESLEKFLERLAE